MNGWNGVGIAEFGIFIWCLFCPMGISADNVHGLVLAVSSSIFIGSSFIVKKKGLTNARGTGTGAGLFSFASFYFISNNVVSQLCFIMD